MSDDKEENKTPINELKKSLENVLNAKKMKAVNEKYLKKIKELEKKVKEMEEEKNNLNNFKNSKDSLNLQKEIEEQKKIIETLKENQRKSKEEVKKEKKKSLEKLSEEKNYQKSLKNFEKNIQILEATKKKNEEEIKILKEEIEEMKEKEENLKIEKDEIFEDLNTKNAKLKVFIDEIENLEERCKFEFEEKQRLEHEVIKMKDSTKLREISEEKDILEDKILKLKVDFEKINKENKKLKEESKNSELQILSLKEKINEKNEKNTNSENYKKIISELQNKIKEKESIKEKDINKGDILLREDKNFWVSLIQKYFNLIEGHEDNLKNFYENVLSFKKNEYKKFEGKKFKKCKKCKKLKKKLKKKIKYLKEEVVDNKEIITLQEEIIKKHESHTNDWSEKSLEALKKTYKSNVSLNHSGSNDIEENKESLNKIIEKNHKESVDLLASLSIKIEKLKKKNFQTKFHKSLDSLEKSVDQLDIKILNQLVSVIEEQSKRIENILEMKEIADKEMKRGIEENKKGLVVKEIKEVVYKKKYEDICESIEKLKYFFEAKNKDERKLFRRDIGIHINKLKPLSNKNVQKLVKDLRQTQMYLDEIDSIESTVKEFFENFDYSEN